MATAIRTAHRRATEFLVYPRALQIGLLVALRTRRRRGRTGLTSRISSA
ncbi:hypothetical protein GPX89_10335 [Nocardia sp. ET3-3]|uniref:Uncharacterized protein n=1 Tax=Nocardia terrae TaxID=2675851 RepID=A0A7K1UTE7_9NOCA|nr:hypothetical protein [Nocardia terrae]MVU77636.1 hypothetical protein [Nocardia terrae]